MKIADESRVIMEIDAPDEAAYDQYSSMVRQLLLRHDGRYLAKDGAIEALAGALPPGRIDILGFVNMESAQAFLNSTEFQALARTRLQSTGPHAMSLKVSLLDVSR